MKPVILAASALIAMAALPAMLTRGVARPA